MALQNQEFLELTIPLDKLSAEDKETVTAFNRRFPPHDAYLETSGHLVVLKLKQLDFGRLEEFFHIQPTRLSKAVFEAVAQIKSYNIRGSKRIYANYGAERKVKDRKQKEQKRDKIYYAKITLSPANVLPPEFENKILCGDSLELLKELIIVLI